MNLTSTEFKKLQETDKRLDKLRKKIESKSDERPRQWGTEVYYIEQKNGLMYRQFTSPPEKGSVVHKQLVLPHSLRESVLEVAHDSILGGHLATKKTYEKKKVWFYIALYPVHWTAQSALHFPPLADLFIPTPFSASLGSILAMQQLRNDYSLTFPPLSIARYSFIQLSRLRRREVKENAQTSKRY